MMKQFCFVLSALMATSVLIAERESGKKRVKGGEFKRGGNAPSYKGEAPAKLERVERVGGEFRVASIVKQGGGFMVKFASTDPKASIREIRLESNHVHVSIERGKVVRLSAEVIARQGAVVEAGQVLVFLPVRGSHLPVWLLSRKEKGITDLRGARYIDMHAPQSDYLLF